LNSPDVNRPQQFIAFNYWSRITKRDGLYVPRPEAEKRRVNTVPWSGANAFCEWLSKKTGRRFRLPTEAEWEFTARGTEGRFYPWGDEEVKWTSYEPTAKDEEPGIKPSVYSIAEAFPANVTPDGVVGMFDYVGEWVSDYYADYPRKEEIDPTGPKDPPDLSPWRDQPPGYRVLRRSLFALTERAFGLDADQAGIYGFRVLMELDEDQPEHRKVPSVDFPLELTLRQRTTKPLPYSDGKLLLTIGDITWWQVRVSLSWLDGEHLFSNRSLRENDIVTFTVGNQAYKLKLKTLTNTRIAEDYAVFQLWPATAERAQDKP
jgi:hypothetical protein